MMETRTKTADLCGRIQIPHIGPLEWEGITSSRSKYRESGALRNRQSEGEALRELRVSILSLLMFTPTHPPHRFSICHLRLASHPV